MSVQDTLGRPLRDLRISVTDRCNFRFEGKVELALAEGAAGPRPSATA